MEIRPGDTVLLPVDMGMTHAEIHELRAELTHTFPGVTWAIQRKTMLSSALVYRRPGSMVDMVATAESMRSKLWTALDLIDKILDVLMADRKPDVEQVKRWREWATETRETIKESIDG